MKRSRRSHAATFKAKLAVAAIKGDRTLVGLSEQFKVRPNQSMSCRSSARRNCSTCRARRYTTCRRRQQGSGAGVDAAHRHRGAVQKLTTHRRHPAPPVYPYLLRGLSIATPNQVWAMDTSYIPMRRGLVSRTVVLDWATSRVLMRWLGHARCEPNSDVHELLGAQTNGLWRVLRRRSDSVHVVSSNFEELFSRRATA